MTSVPEDEEPVCGSSPTSIASEEHLDMDNDDTNLSRCPSDDFAVNLRTDPTLASLRSAFSTESVTLLSLCQLLPVKRDAAAARQPGAGNSPAFTVRRGRCRV